jgi:GTP-binding protein HflX
LIRAFRATLEEVTQASMILHVLDVSSPHRREYRHEVRRILAELEAHEKPVILVLNKVDLVDAAEAAAAVEAERADGSAVDVVAISARGGDGIPSLVESIDRHLPLDQIVTERYRFRHDEGDKISFLYQHANVVERKDKASGVEIVAEVPESVRVRFAAHVAKPAAAKQRSRTRG